MNSFLDNIPDFTTPTWEQERRFIRIKVGLKTGKIAKHVHAEEFAISIMYVQYAANTLFVVLALLGICPTRASRKAIAPPMH
jgi:hypothetical protein